MGDVKTRTFTADQLNDLDIPYSDDTVYTEYITSGRWVDHWSAVFEFDGKHYQVDYQTPATEMQECDRWYDDVVTATEVHQVPVTVMSWVPVSAGESPAAG